MLPSQNPTKINSQTLYRWRVDWALIAGLLIALSSIICFWLSGNDHAFLSWFSALLFVLFGSLGQSIAGTSGRQICWLGKRLASVFVRREILAYQVLCRIVELAEQSERSRGKAVIGNCYDKSLPLITRTTVAPTEGLDAATVIRILEDQAVSDHRREIATIQVLERARSWARVMGVLGSIISLTQATEHLNNTEMTCGHIYSGFVVMLCSLVITDFFYLPLSSTLRNHQNRTLRIKQATIVAMTQCQDGLPSEIIKRTFEASGACD